MPSWAELNPSGKEGHLVLSLPLGCQSPPSPCLSCPAPSGPPGNTALPLPTLLLGSWWAGADSRFSPVCVWEGFLETVVSAELKNVGISGRALGAPRISGGRGAAGSVVGTAELPGGARANACGSLPPTLLLGLGLGPARPAKPQCQVFQKNFPRRLALGMLGGGAGLGPGSGPNSAAPATVGFLAVAAMCPAAAPGRAAWVLAGGFLAAALALPAGPRGRGWLPAGPSPLRGPLGAQAPRDRPAAPGAGPDRTALVRRSAPRLRCDSGGSAPAAPAAGCSVELGNLLDRVGVARCSLVQASYP